MLYNDDWIWIVCLAFLFSFLLAFGLGANDVASSFGTSVGSKVLTLRQACILATIFEFAGSVLLGQKVSNTIRKGIVDISMFNGTEDVFLCGEVAALGGATGWLVIATAFKLPVSGTHSVVGAVVGFALVAGAGSHIKWKKLGTIVISWFISPVLAGIVSTLAFIFIKKMILDADKPLDSGLNWIPVFYSMTVAINLFSIVYGGSPLLYLDRVPIWGCFALAIGAGIITAIIVRVLVVPWQRVKITDKCSKKMEMDLYGKAENKNSITDAEKQAMVDTEDDDPAGIKSPVNKIVAGLKEIGKKGEQRLLERALSIDVAAQYQRHLEKRTNSIGENQFPGDIHHELLYNMNAHTWHPPRRPAERASVLPQTKRTRLITDPGQPAAALSEGCVKKAVDDDTQSAGGDDRREPLVGKRVQINTPTMLAKAAAANRAKIADAEANDTCVVLDAITIKEAPAADEVPLVVERNGAALEPIAESTASSMGKIGKSPVVQESMQTAEMFSLLQILTAIFGAFAHGGNDVSNAVAPLVALWITARTGSVLVDEPTPIWILAFGGVGIVAGLWVWGRRVIETLGENLTKITPSSGFCIEIGSAITVLLASNAGLPISSTHCKVGSVVFVGRYRSRTNVDWSLFKNIVLSWVLTVPAATAISAVILAILKYGVLQIDQTPAFDYPVNDTLAY